MDFNTGSSGRTGNRNLREEPPRRLTVNDFDTSDFVSSFVEVTRRIVTNPLNFYRTIPEDGPSSKPLAYALACSIIPVFFYTLLVLLLPIFGGNFFEGSPGVVLLLVFYVFLEIVGVTLSAYLYSGVLHLFVILLAGSSSGYAATFRANAYASVSAVLYVIPVLGLLAPLVHAALTGVGLRELHNTSTIRAVVIVLAPTIVVLVLLVMFVVGQILPAYLSGG